MSKDFGDNVLSLSVGDYYAGAKCLGEVDSTWREITLPIRYMLSGGRATSPGGMDHGNGH